MKQGEKCPGEIFCESEGKCFERRTTVKIFCKAENCELYYTKDDSTPVEFSSFVSIASILRERKENGRDLQESIYPFQLVEAYSAAERVYIRVENERTANPSQKDESLDISKGGDSDAFANLEAEFAST